jgi:tetratricopeptide (TPR) repeat protein
MGKKKNKNSPLPLTGKLQLPAAGKTGNYQPWLMTAVIALLVLIIYQSCFNAGLTNWDESIYIQKNPYIRDLSFANIKRIFSAPVYGIYAPLSFLSFAIDHYFAGLEGSRYHIVNIILHILNCTWLFLIIFKLSKNSFVAFITTLIFAIHPMQVEAVAWAASRKDVLYTFFFFSAWWFYLEHLERKSGFGFLLLAFLLFGCSLLSKNQAVTLPVVLLISQLFIEKQWKKKRIAELALFFFLSLLLGLYTLGYAKEDALDYRTPFTFMERIYYSFAAFGNYVIKFFFPYPLSGIYNFPGKSSLSFIVQLASGIILAAIVVWAAIKYRFRFSWLSAGLAFFTVSIFLVLHLIATNSSLIYERFSYVACIGLAFIIANGFMIIRGRWKIIASVLLAAFFISLFYLSYERAAIWKDSMSLWNDIIEKNPGAEQAFNNRASVLITAKKYDEALADVNKALEIEPKLSQAYANLGNIYRARGKMAEAISAFDKALLLSPTHLSTRLNRAIAYSSRGEYNNAVMDLKICIRQMPQNEEAYRLLGIAYARLDSIELAEINLRKSYALDSSKSALRILANEYFQKGTKLLSQKNNDGGIFYLSRCIALEPTHVNALYNMGGAYFDKGDKAKAIELWESILKINPDYPQAKSSLQKAKQQ